MSARQSEPRSASDRPSAASTKVWRRLARPRCARPLLPSKPGSTNSSLLVGARPNCTAAPPEKVEGAGEQPVVEEEAAAPRPQPAKGKGPGPGAAKGKGPGLRAKGKGKGKGPGQPAKPPAAKSEE